eukprot:Lithocolla_globosa_v1_NODE_1576_length_2473_cov_8.800662.p1 type:complete len:422 gc:universal NODE_1576_length_2473_cov_8.800662:1455-190(-)
MGHELDSGGAWVRAFAAFWVTALTFGMMYSFGPFQDYYMSYFDASASAVAWISSLQLGFFCLTAFFSGNIGQIYGRRKVIALGLCLSCASLLAASFSTQLWHLYITQGAVYGVGVALACINSVGAVSLWFDQRKGIAMGLVASGSGVGGLVISPSVQALIECQDWQLVLRLFAGVIAIFIPGAYFLHERQTQVSKSENPSFFDFSIMFRNDLFLLLLLTAILVSFGQFTPYNFLPTYSSDLGFDAFFGSLLVGFANGSSAFGRIAFGAAADYFAPSLAMTLCLFIAALSTGLWPLCTSQLSLMIYACVFGFNQGGFIALSPILCGHLFGAARVGSGFGVVNGVMLFGFLLGPPFAGRLYDQNQDFLASILVAAGFFLAASFCCAVISFLGWRREKHATSYDSYQVLKNQETDDEKTLLLRD